MTRVVEHRGDSGLEGLLAPGGLDGTLKVP